MLWYIVDGREVTSLPVYLFVIFVHGAFCCTCGTRCTSFVHGLFVHWAGTLVHGTGYIFLLLSSGRRDVMVTVMVLLMLVMLICGDGTSFTYSVAANRRLFLPVAGICCSVVQWYIVQLLPVFLLVMISSM